MNLSEYVIKNAARGSCTCGKCCDAPSVSVKPGKHAVNLTFFEVSTNFAAYAKPEIFVNLAKAEYPKWFDGKEHSYIEIGAAMGDQGLALMTIGLGHLLGAWKALSPDTVMPFLPEKTKQEMAGGGMVSLTAHSAQNQRPDLN